MKSLYVFDKDRTNKAKFAQGEKFDVQPVGSHTHVLVDEVYSLFIPGNAMFEVLEENDV